MKRNTVDAEHFCGSALVVTAFVKNAEDVVKVEGTPTFVIDGKVYGGELSIDQLKAILDPLIKK